MSKMKIVLSVFMVACMLTWLIGLSTDASSTQPGTVNDPIVTKSYVDQKFGELKQEVDERITLLASELTTRVETSETEEPDESQDPIISDNGDSEVDMDLVFAYIDNKFEVMEESLKETAQSGNDHQVVGEGSSVEPVQSTGLFAVIEVTNGQKVICGASTELILRAGGATVIAGANGDGLADLTSGADLAGGDEVPKQHHLLVSRDDGRGLLIVSEGTSYILIKGAYTIE